MKQFEPTSTQTPAIPHSLEDCLARGKAAHPGVLVDGAAFAQYVGERRSSLQAEPALHAEDLYLAFACLQQHPAAIALLKERLDWVVGAAVSRAGMAADRASDVLQLMQMALLLPEGEGAAKLRQYSGRGPLDAWLRAVALGTALNLRQSERAQCAEVSDERLLNVLAFPGLGPERRHLQDSCGEEVKLALERALATLSPGERTLLRLRFLDNLSTEEIGRLQGAHRATVARWLSASYERLLGSIRRDLATQAGVPLSQVESFARLGLQAVEASLTGLLKDPPVEGA